MEGAVTEHKGRVVNGVVVLEDADALPDGTEVRVIPLQPEPRPKTLGQRLLKFAGTIDGLPSDMAENHDHYLHGQPKK